MSSTRPLRLGAVICVYLLLNSTLNILNRWTLGVYGFRFPIFLTVCHMMFSSFVLAPVMALPTFWKLHPQTLARQWKGLLYIGAFLAANISLNNFSLVHITLALNQIIRASIPVATAALAYFVEGRRVSRQEAGSLVVLSSGVMLAVWQGSVSGSPIGVMFCVAATLSNAAMMTWSSKVMSEKIDVLRLTFYTAPVSCAILLPFCVYTEVPALMQYYVRNERTAAGVILLLGSANALAYNAVHYLLIQMTSAVTTTVLGMIKIVGLVLISSALLGESQVFDFKLVAGAILTFSGFCAYSWLRMLTAHKSQQHSSENTGSKGATVALLKDRSPEEAD